MKRKKYEEKFDVDVTDDPSTGTTNVKDREKDEVSMLMDKLKNNRSISVFRIISPIWLGSKRN